MVWTVHTRYWYWWIVIDTVGLDWCRLIELSRGIWLLIDFYFHICWNLIMSLFSFHLMQFGNPNWRPQETLLETFDHRFIKFYWKFLPNKWLVQTPMNLWSCSQGLNFCFSTWWWPQGYIPYLLLPGVDSRQT